MKKEKYFAISPRIARWKLDTPIENWLSYKADFSEFWKKIYILYYSICDSKYHRVGVKMAREAIKAYAIEQYISNIDDTIRDMIYCLHRFGYSFQDYCLYNFVNNKDIKYRTSFVADKLRYHYCDILNSPELLQIMTNKYICYEKYKKFYKREVIGCMSEEDLEEFVKFTSSHKRYIYKPLEEHSGHGIMIVNTDETDSKKFFHEKISLGAFVVEELIEQGNAMALFHPHSVNTCRVLTFTINDKVDILAATWRIGSGGDTKDNAGAGGLYAYINQQSGVIETDAYNFKGEHFEAHPDSGIVFKGYQMPLWDEAVTLTKEMAVNIKGSTLIAWDIAYSKNGWVMVEANENGAYRILQSNKKEGLKATLYLYMDKYFKANDASR